MTCKKHPRYQAKRAPTADCQRCRDMWESTSMGTSAASFPKPAQARLTAADLIAKKAGLRKHAAPSAEALKELREILAYNDEARHIGDRVSKADAIQMLRAHGWAAHGTQTLDRLCQEVLDRKSYAQK